MSDPLNTRAWFCLRARPKSEHIAAVHLRLIGDVEVYCPRLRFRKMTRRGPVWFSEALFPGYLFARFTPMESQREVAAARGMSSLVRFGGMLAVVPDSAIAELQATMGDEDCKTIDAEMREGDTVTVTAGIFQGLQTLVIRLTPASERVRVLVAFLGECREVEVEKSGLLPDHKHILAA